MTLQAERTRTVLNFGCQSMDSILAHWDSLSANDSCHALEVYLLAFREHSLLSPATTAPTDIEAFVAAEYFVKSWPEHSPDERRQTIQRFTNHLKHRLHELAGH